MSFLRLLFAALVLLDHSFPLGGFNHGRDPMWSWTDGQESFGGLAVAGFFVLSGFLVTRSFEGSKDVISYLWKRFLRIFPGFWVCLLITVLVFAPIAYSFQDGHVGGYWRTGSQSPLGYLTGNWLLTIHQYNVDGLLSSTPFQRSGYAQAFDGSLWTLAYEFRCYLGVAMLGALGIFRRRRFLVLLISLFLWTVQLEESLHPTRLHNWFLLGDVNMARLAFIFSLGVLIYLYREHVPVSAPLAFIALFALVVSFRTQLYDGVGLWALAYLCIYASIRIPLYRADRFGDFSYGLYIYAFPVEQLMALYGLQRFGWVFYVLMSLLGTLALAILSWHLVERPCLSLKRLSVRLPRRLPRRLPDRRPTPPTGFSHPAGLSAPEDS